ncbi:MAG: CYTH domain-containing protein [bacterium]|nr:CYTH domain-containing protein [bacterium]
MRNTAVLRAALESSGAVRLEEQRVIDHWYVPQHVLTKAQHDAWFDRELGTGVRIREIRSDTEPPVLSLETKRLREVGHYEVFVESAVVVDSYADARSVLEELGRREFATVDKARIVYRLGPALISEDSITGVGTFVELELEADVDDAGGAVEYLERLATLLGLSDADRVATTATAIAMEELSDLRD